MRRLHEIYDTAIEQNERPKEVFVLIRVYNLLERKPRFKVFVDPGRLEGTMLEFDQQWTVTTNVEV